MSVPRNQQEANEQGPDLHLQQNVIICDLKSRMPKTLRKQLRGKNVIYNDCTRYTDLCDEVVVMRMNELKHDVRNMYCEFYGVETDEELRECVSESLSTGDEEFKELRKQIQQLEQKMTKSPNNMNNGGSHFLYHRERMIKFKLMQAGISQKKLAKHLNLTESYISKLIIGERYNQDFEIFLRKNLEIDYCFI